MITNISKIPRQTGFGSMIFYGDDRNKYHQEFATEDEADEFAKELEREMEELRYGS